MPNAQPDEEGESLTDAHMHSFIVRVWLEEMQSDTLSPVWRGHVRHIPGGELRYFGKLSEIAEFIEAHLRTQR